MFDQVSNDVHYCGRASRFATAENYGCIRGQGGVAILWKKNLVCITEVKNVVHDRICVVRFQAAGGGGLYTYTRCIFQPKGVGKILGPSSTT